MRFSHRHAAPCHILSVSHGATFPKANEGGFPWLQWATLDDSVIEGRYGAVTLRQPQKRWREMCTRHNVHARVLTQRMCADWWWKR